jgi:hypothetical protein
MLTWWNAIPPKPASKQAGQEFGKLVLNGAGFSFLLLGKLITNNEPTPSEEEDCLAETFRPPDGRIWHSNLDSAKIEIKIPSASPIREENKNYD